LVFFFDEAHLLFDDAPEALQDKIEQVVRLIRSKGVGVYFVTQNPLDVPEKVLGQLGNRVQHALRAFTPREQKAVRAAAQTFRANPHLDVEAAITELGVGEALVSVLDVKGVPTKVERAYIVPPHGQIGPIDDAQRRKLMEASPVAGHYDKTVDRESAYEVLKGKTAPDQAKPTGDDAAAAAKRDAFVKSQGTVQQATKTGKSTIAGAAFRAFMSFTTSAARSVGSFVGRQLTRGLLGNLLGDGKRRR
jgi:hypothetical protein